MAGAGFQQAAASSLRNNRSLRRERGTYFKKRDSETQRYVMTKSSKNTFVSKRELEQKYNQKLWKIYAISGAVGAALTWWILQFIDL